LNKPIIIILNYYISCLWCYSGYTSIPGKLEKYACGHGGNRTYGYDLWNELYQQATQKKTFCISVGVILCDKRISVIGRSSAIYVEITKYKTAYAHISPLRRKFTAEQILYLGTDFCLSTIFHFSVVFAIALASHYFCSKYLIALK
jgi:hypothetical protein